MAGRDGGTRSPFPGEGLPWPGKCPVLPGTANRHQLHGAEPGTATASGMEGVGMDRQSRGHGALDGDAPPGARKALAGIARGAGAARGTAGLGPGTEPGWGGWCHAAPLQRPGGPAWGWRDPSPFPREPRAGQGLQPPPQGTVPTPHRHCLKRRAPRAPAPHAPIWCPAPALPEPGGRRGPGKGQARNDNVFPKGIDTLLLLFNTTPYKTEAAAAILIEGPKLK